MYRKLNAESLVTTIHKLLKRIHERFPDSGLNRVCAELLAIGEESKAQCLKIARPQITLRIGVGIVIIAVGVMLAKALLAQRISSKPFELGEFIQMFEAGINAIVLISAAILFLITVENRIKRARALKKLYELRAVAHVIDMHQLTKDPRRLLAIVKDTPSSPKHSFDVYGLIRYLDYCSEMLSLVGKIGALYVQNLHDPTILAAVSELETLTTNLSRQIWQKIIILYQLQLEGDEI